VTRTFSFFSPFKEKETINDLLTYTSKQIFLQKRTLEPRIRSTKRLRSLRSQEEEEDSILDNTKKKKGIALYKGVRINLNRVL